MASAQRSDPEKGPLVTNLGEHNNWEWFHPWPEPQRDLSLERLERPLEVVTVERLGWALVALYAILTRLAFLAARPIDASEARQALFESGLPANGLPTRTIARTPYGGWGAIRHGGV